MTLTLNDIEVIEYMNSTKRIEELTAKVNELTSIMDMAYLEQAHTHVPEEPIVEETIPTQEISDAIKPLGLWTKGDWIAYVGAKEVPETRKGSAWVEGEDNIIQIAVDQTHPAFKISNIAKFLGRSIGAINSRAIQSGYSVKKNFIIKD